MSASRSIRRGRSGGIEGSDAPAPTAPHDSEARRHEVELLARATTGDPEALAELYAAHRPMAEKVAARTCRPCDVDDVVSEAFAKVIDQMRRGGGPRVSFRAYLITAVRTSGADMARRHARSIPVDDIEAAQPTTGHAPREQPHSLLRLESQLLTEALASLPTRWQLAVWWASVEGLSLTEVGHRLGINANAAAALTFRAREGLREAYLSMHVEQGADPTCAPWRDDLPALVRGTLSPGRTTGATAHLRQCLSCRDVTDRLRELLLTGVPC